MADAGDEYGEKLKKEMKEAMKEFLKWLFGGRSNQKGANGLDLSGLEDEINRVLDNFLEQNPSLLDGSMPEGDVERTGEQAPNHTEEIAQKVAAAREACDSFDDFRETLAREGIGTTVGADGENMFYKARIGEDGNLLPMGRDASGMRDWAVGAKALKDNYGVDATQDSFERDAPQATDGSLHMDGRTPDPDQGIESHDGMDTDPRTRRIDREQNGTDVAPSKSRNAAESHKAKVGDYARDAEEWRDQRDIERGVGEHETDLSDKMDHVR